MTQAPPATSQQIASYTQAYIATKAAARAQVVGTVLAAWATLTSWRDADIKRFARTVAPIVTGGQSHIAAMTTAYLSAVLQFAGAGLGRLPALPQSKMTGAALRAGTAPYDVYQRPGHQIWNDLSNGAPLEQAVSNGRLRVQQLAQTDIQLASTHAAQRVLDSSPHVVGYRRVLTGSHSCALCTVSATQRYHRAELLPIHPGCDCTVAPIVGSEDPGRVLDQDALDQAHADIRQRLGSDTNDPAKLRAQIVVHHHGELGPVLAAAGQHFTGPSSIP